MMTFVAGNSTENRMWLRNRFVFSRGLGDKFIDGTLVKMLAGLKARPLVGNSA